MPQLLLMVVTSQRGFSRTVQRRTSYGNMIRLLTPGNSWHHYPAHLVIGHVGLNFSEER